MSASTSRAYPRRAMQLLWLAAGILFTFAVIRSLSPDTSSREWISKGVSTLVSNGRLSMKEHMRLAEASWAKTVKQRHELIDKDYGGDRDKMSLYPVYDVHTYFTHPYSVWDFTPASYGCPHEIERVGRMGDGGKWVCGMSAYEKMSRQRKMVIYSFGVQNESSFENEMLDRTNSEIWAYDFSVVELGQALQPQNLNRAHFKQVGISGKTDEAHEPPFYTIQDLMAQNGHDYIDILKMDIEFAEFESLHALMDKFKSAKTLPFGQIMVEIHLFNDIKVADYLKWWERLEEHGLRPTFTEPNLLAVNLNLSGNKDPNMAEYTLINVKDPRNMLFNGLTI